ncbi:MAG TPA: hypothetical protein VLY24_28550 [Bryobacteraceae bacterium]|nr:hypothetical protein [Bryobacteraceae bacterium]
MTKTIVAALLLFLTVAAVSASAQINQAPTLTKKFGASEIVVGQTTTLTFVLSNPNGSTLTNVQFTDSMPAGLLFENLVSETCTEPVVSSNSQPSMLSVSIDLDPFETCTIVLSVEAVQPGVWVNTTSTVTSESAPDGTAATDTITVVPADSILIGYAANLTVGDSIINLTNVSVGQSGGSDPEICANVYVFAEDQQLIACCTCQLTPNHLQTLSAQKDLISNTLTPGVPLGITTLLVASEGNSGTCDASKPGTLLDGLRAWGTTLHAAPGGAYAVTETPFSIVSFNPTEVARMQQLCGFIEANGSAYGICNSCKTGAAGAQKQ